MKELGHQNRHLDFLKVDTDKHDGTGFEDTVWAPVWLRPWLYSRNLLKIKTAYLFS